MKKIPEDTSQINLMALEQEIATLLQGKFSDANIKSQESLQPIIHEQITHAYRYGFETEQQFTDYVVTAWQFGDAFDLEFAGVKEMLASPDFEPAEKAEWLLQWTNNMMFASQGIK